MFPQFNEVFWVSFWPGLFSSLATTAILTGVIGYIFYWLRKPKLEVILTVSHSSGRSKTFSLTVKNEGKTSLMPQEAQWYFYFEPCFTPVEDISSTVIGESPVHETTGFNELPCHPGSTITLALVPVEVVNDFPYASIEEATFYCAINTNKGKWAPMTPWFKFRKSRICTKNSNESHRIFAINKVVW